MVAIVAEQRARVLVVEDDEAVSQLLKTVLAAEGYEVICASTDVEAYEELDRKGSSVDALVLDINLGAGTTGFDVARYGRRINASVAVIFISGGAEASVEKFGVADATLVAKPFDIPLLIATLEEKVGPSNRSPTA